MGLRVTEADSVEFKNTRVIDMFFFIVESGITLSEEIIVDWVRGVSLLGLGLRYIYRCVFSSSFQDLSTGTFGNFNYSNLIVHHQLWPGWSIGEKD